MPAPDEAREKTMPASQSRFESVLISTTFLGVRRRKRAYCSQSTESVAR
jgi:hypothetical protein